MDNVTMHALPGQSKMDGLWYYIIDEDEVKEFTKNVFNNNLESLPNQ